MTSKTEQQKRLRGMLTDLLEIEEGLNDKDVNFIERLSRRKRDLTDYQSGGLERLWNKKVGAVCTHN